MDASRFTARLPTIREQRRAIVIVLEQLVVPNPAGAIGLDLVAQVVISVHGAEVRALAIDWVGVPYETRRFCAVEEAVAFYQQEGPR